MAKPAPPLRRLTCDRTQLISRTPALPASTHSIVSFTGRDTGTAADSATPIMLGPFQPSRQQISLTSAAKPQGIVKSRRARSFHSNKLAYNPQCLSYTGSRAVGDENDGYLAGLSKSSHKYHEKDSFDFSEVGGYLRGGIKKISGGNGMDVDVQQVKVIQDIAMTIPDGADMVSAYDRHLSFTAPFDSHATDSEMSDEMYEADTRTLELGEVKGTLNCDRNLRRAMETGAWLYVRS